MTNSPAGTLYFIAILCPDDLDKRITTYKIWMNQQFGCRVALKSPPHITLIPPFRIRMADESRLVNTFAYLTTSIPELGITITGFDHFGKRVIYAKVEDNQGLHKLKEQTMAHFQTVFGLQIPTDHHPFHPHISIATRDLDKNDFEKAWSHFASIPFNEHYKTSTISLLRLTEGKWKVIDQKYWV